MRLRKYRRVKLRFLPSPATVCGYIDLSSGSGSLAQHARVAILAVGHETSSMAFASGRV